METDSESDSGGDCPIGSLNCRCTNAGTCDPGLVCASETCTPGSDETGEPTTSTGDTSVTEIETSESSSSEPSQCDPGGDGSPDPACDEAHPYCLAGACFDCGGIVCADVSPALPVCDADSGLCAACDCDDSTPVCDAASHTCSKCTDHGQCPDSACDLWTGACLPITGALWVDRDGVCDDAASGAEDDPLCSLGEAFARVNEAPEVPHAIRVRPADYDVDDVLHVPMGALVALVHATGGDGVRLVAPSSEALTVDAEGSLLVDGIEITGPGADGLACAGGRMWLDRLSVSGAAGHGVYSDDCSVKLRRGVLTSNVRSGVSVAVADVSIENTYISKNGNIDDGGGGINLAGGASLKAVYVTLIDNLAVAGVPYSVACNVDDPAIEEVRVRNSVAINLGTNTMCPGATVETTAWSAMEAGVSNLVITYQQLADYLTEDAGVAGVYRAIEGTELDQLAKWVDGDPKIDFDGDPRPSGDNSPDFAGADRIRRE